MTDTDVAEHAVRALKYAVAYSSTFDTPLVLCPSITAVSTASAAVRTEPILASRADVDFRLTRLRPRTTDSNLFVCSRLETKFAYFTALFGRRCRIGSKTAAASAVASFSAVESVVKL